MAAMHALGMYLVGVGELITPTPKEVLRQAKVVGQAISAKVYPDGLPALLPGGLCPGRPGLTRGNVAPEPTRVRSGPPEGPEWRYVTPAFRLRSVSLRCRCPRPA